MNLFPCECCNSGSHKRESVNYASQPFLPLFPQRFCLSASKLSFPEHPSFSPPLGRQKAAAAASPVSSPSQGLQIPSDLQGHKTHLLLRLSCFNQPLQLKQLFYNSLSTCSRTRLLQSICFLVSDCILHVLWDIYIHIQYRRIHALLSLNTTWAVQGHGGESSGNIITLSSRLLVLQSHNFFLLHCVLTAEAGLWTEVDTVSLCEGKAKKIRNSSKTVTCKHA